MALDHPLMKSNITREDLDCLIEYLKGDDPRLTQGGNVKKFEEEWSKWLGVKYSIFVNSGSSANYLTIAALKYLYGEGEIILPPLTWSSDVSSVLTMGFTPVFVDINMNNLAMKDDLILEAITPNTKAVFLTHILGFNGLSQKLLDELDKRNILLIEDVCESHGATFKGQRLGSYGFASNFSFYYAHHMSTIEGGVVCTNNEEFYETVRMLRSHGMVREVTSEAIKEKYKTDYPDLNPDFIFSHPGFNMRSTEINAVIGLSQLKNLDDNNLKRIENCKTFYENLDPELYRTDFDFEGCVNYAFVLVLNNADNSLRDKLEQKLQEEKVEYRRGTSGGGNQLRQPYLRNKFENEYYKKFTNTEHVHFYGYYMGNYPELEKENILKLCEILNSIK